MKLNEKGVEYAKELVKKGKYEVGSDWSQVQPSTDDEKSFLDEHGRDQFGKWYLGIDTDEDKQDPRAHFDFPYGDFDRVHRSGVIAVKQRAGQYDYDDVLEAADEILQLIDENED